MSHFASVREQHPTAAEYRDLFAGILVLAGCLIVALGGTLWSEQQGRPNLQRLLVKPAQISGWPTAVDPLALVPILQQSHGLGALREIYLMGVSNDGTLNMANGSVRGRLVFEERREQSGTCRTRTVTLGRNGVVVAAATEAWGSCGPVLPRLGCGPRRLFSMAKSRGVDQRQRANIRTELGKSGPLWKMTMTGPSFSLVTDLDCRREYSRAELASPNR